MGNEGNGDRAPVREVVLAFWRHEQQHIGI